VVLGDVEESMCGICTSYRGTTIANDGAVWGLLFRKTYAQVKGAALQLLQCSSADYECREFLGIKLARGIFRLVGSK